MSVFCPNGHENPETNRFCQACGSKIVVPITQNLTTGVLLGDRYRITAEIGQGGFGRTYLCEDINRFNELCVLKEFAPQVQGTALLTKAQQLFEREAGVMYRLQHPQIPMFREMFRVNRGGVGQLFLVQDYVDGINYQGLLRQKLQQGKRFTEAEITEFLKQILPVLGYIHSLGVIHRDISPDNLIQRNSDGQPVLIDFGGVKQVAVNAANQYMSASGGTSDIPTRLGKVGYAPNEQMQRGVVFPHSDLYALAATALVLLTGKEPPDLIDPQNFTWNWREHVELSPKLASVLDRMLQLRPNDRFESARDVLAALEIGEPSSLPYTSPTPPVPTRAGSQTKSPAATLVAETNQQQAALTPTTVATFAAPSWMVIAAVIGAVGCGWVVASIVSNGSKPNPAPKISNTPAPAAGETSTPTSVASQTSSSTPTISTQPTTPTPSATPISAFEPTLPAVLARMGVNDRAYGNAVRQIFISQNPRVRSVQTGDSQVRSQLDAIASELGNKLTNHLDRHAIQKIGRYRAADRATWRAQLNKLHLSERALIDLTDTKYRTITEFTAQKLGIGFDRFVHTPMGQVYLATMFDRVRAIQSKQAIGEIVFPAGGTSGKVSGTLQPGEGKAYLASLFGGQDIGVNIAANEPTNLSIYPPRSSLPAMLTTSQTKNWSGKTSINGYHELVLVSHSDRPIQYELTLSAADLKPSNAPRPDPHPDKSPLW